MALLKKIKSATLIEALIATVLIMVVFVIASMILNNLLVNSFRSNTHAVDNRISELEYKAQHDFITLPYKESHGVWDISLEMEGKDTLLWVSSNAVNRETKKGITRKRLYEGF